MNNDKAFFITVIIVSLIASVTIMYAVKENTDVSELKIKADHGLVRYEAPKDE